jgi:hypothetical protein
MSRPKARVGPARGDVWTVNFDPVVGHEQGGVRPALIVSVNVMNQSPAGPDRFRQRNESEPGRLSVRGAHNGNG